MYLTNNPDYTHLKSQYNTHTNFSKFILKTDPEGYNVDRFDFDDTVNFNIEKPADLLLNVNLQIEISGHDWEYIRNVVPETMYALIEYIEITSNDKILEKLTGEGIYLLHQLYNQNMKYLTTMSSANNITTQIYPEGNKTARLSGTTFTPYNFSTTTLTATVDANHSGAQSLTIKITDSTISGGAYTDLVGLVVTGIGIDQLPTTHGLGGSAGDTNGILGLAVVTSVSNPVVSGYREITLDSFPIAAGYTIPVGTVLTFEGERLVLDITNVTGGSKNNGNMFHLKTNITSVQDIVDIIKSSKNDYLVNLYSSLSNDAYRDYGNQAAQLINANVYINHSGMLEIAGKSSRGGATISINAKSGTNASLLIGSPTTTTSKEIEKKYILNLPIPFWFCDKPGHSIPLWAIQHESIKINLKLRRFAEITGPDSIGNIVNQPDYKINSICLINEYIDLTEKEKSEFQEKPLEYVIEQVECMPAEKINLEKNGVSAKQTINIKRSQLVNELFWVFKMVNPDKYSRVNYFSFRHKRCGSEANGHYGGALTGSEYHTNNISISLNGNKISKKPSSYYTTIERSNNHNNSKPYKYDLSDNIDTGYIYCYSFGLNPDKMEPSGFLSLDKFNNITLDLEMNGNSVARNILVFLKKFNLMRIQNGHLELLCN